MALSTKKSLCSVLHWKNKAFIVSIFAILAFSLTLLISHSSTTLCVLSCFFTFLCVCVWQRPKKPLFHSVCLNVHYTIITIKSIERMKGEERQQQQKLKSKLGN